GNILPGISCTTHQPYELVNLIGREEARLTHSRPHAWIRANLLPQGSRVPNVIPPQAHQARAHEVADVVNLPEHRFRRRVVIVQVGAETADSDYSTSGGARLNLLVLEVLVRRGNGIHIAVRENERLLTAGDGIHGCAIPRV